MYRCERCGEIFDEPDSKEICFESYYGVGSMFQDRHYGSVAICPECGTEDIEKYYEGEDLWED